MFGNLLTRQVTISFTGRTLAAWSYILIYMKHMYFGGLVNFSIPESHSGGSWLECWLEHSFSRL